MTTPNGELAVHGRTFVLSAATLPGPEGVAPSPTPGVAEVQAPSAPIAAPAATASTAPAAAAGGGSGIAAPAPSFTGKVVASDGGTERGLGGALVWTTDGRQATAAADGSFVLTGSWPADGALSASLPGYVASAAAGLEPGPVVLHLHPPIAPPTRTDVPDNTVVVARGRVVDPAGQPVEGVVVALADARGSSSGTAVTAADGSFQLNIRAPGRTVVDGTLLAVGTAWVGMATGLAVGPAGGDLDLAPASPATDPLVLVPADHPVDVAVDAGAATGEARVTIDMVAPDGTSLSVVGTGVGADGKVRAMVGPLSGVRYALDVEAVSPDGLVRSARFEEDLGIDFAAPTTDRAVTLLPAPVLAAPPTLAPGSAVAWSPVPGANGYEVTVNGFDGRGLLWEGYTPSPGLTFGPAEPLTPGRYGLTVTAFQDEALSPRTVAAVPEGPRALKRLPSGTRYSLSSRQQRLTL